ncbi:MAG: DUF4080 domain-containing protein [Ruminococcaceae bacterium]|nr:DUF4080 domain-containing protein [Oscillospiraceae bacterium]
MKTVFVAQNSSYTHTNSAVRILARCLEDNGLEAEIVETTIGDRGGAIALCEKLYEKKGDIYAFSVYIWNRSEQLLAASLIKKLIPGCTVVFGGPEVSFEDETFLDQNPFIDYVIRGEGEEAIVEIANGKCEKGFVDFGVYEKFSSSCEPYFSYPEKYGETCGKLIYYETTRGCPFSCSYCLSSVKKKGECVRSKPAELVKQELSHLMSEDIKAIKLVDRTFNYDRKRAYELFSYMIEKSAENLDENGKYRGATIHFEICAALLDEETMTLLEKAPENLFRFEIGVQTANPASLKAIGRADDTGKILENVKRLKEKTNIELHLDLICGLPNDSFSDIRNSFNKVYGNCHKLQMGFLKLLPGTALKNEAGKYKMKSLDVPPYTVLETDKISFFEMMTLTRIAEVAEKFSDAESGFDTAISLMIKNCESPFDFYFELSRFLNEKGSVSSKKLYCEILGFANCYFEGKKALINDIKESLRYDYLMSNQGRCPFETERIYTEDEEKYLAFAKKQFIHSDIRNTQKIFVPALEAHLFSFDCENVYFIDRKNRLCFKSKRP